MVHIDASVNLPSRNPKVITPVPDDHPFPDVVPLVAVIKLLVQVPCVPEELFPDLAIQPEVIIPLLQRRQQDQLRVAP